MGARVVLRGVWGCMGVWEGRACDGCFVRVCEVGGVVWGVLEVCECV